MSEYFLKCMRSVGYFGVCAPYSPMILFLEALENVMVGFVSLSQSNITWGKGSQWIVNIGWSVGNLSWLP